MSTPNYLVWATLLPLGSFVVLVFLGRVLGRAAAWVGTLAILASFALSVGALIPWFSRPTGHETHVVEALTWTWISVGQNETASAGILVDSLTLVMFVVITLVAVLAHFFSIGALADDKRLSRYYAYLGLSCFAMMGLVLSNSLLQMFIFWEVLAIGSYLLMAFWFETRGAARAAGRAMMANAIGSAAFLAGIGILVWQLGWGGLTLHNDDGSAALASRAAMRARVVEPSFGPEQGTLIGQFAAEATRDETAFLRHDLIGPHFLSMSWLTWAGILLFGAALARSAQFPLHVWLADVTETPLPAAALMQSVTMTAAGVYLLARVFGILTLDARLLMALIGCTTVAVGALIALVMTDLRKIMAFSTISQLGLVILFLGCGAYVAGVFHLIMHAFFKSCLVLAAGSVIAGTGRETDITRMGGLWTRMPITALTFGLAALSMAGVPTFSGYYSRELGLAAVYDYAYALPPSELSVMGISFSWMPHLLFWIPAIASYLTAFYLGRVWWLTFAGRPRDRHLHEAARESPVMTMPLIILAIFAWVAGGEFFQIQKLITLSQPIQSLAYAPSTQGTEIVHGILSGASAMGLIAILVYLSGFGVAGRIRRSSLVRPVHLWLVNRMFFDVVYRAIIGSAWRATSMALAIIDTVLVRGVVNLIGYITRLAAWLCAQLEFVIDAPGRLATAALRRGLLVMRWRARA